MQTLAGIPLGGLAPRPGQAALADFLLSGIRENRWQLAAAETGSGKTHAYLAAIVASGKRAVVSTATRALQRQIIDYCADFAVTVTQLHGLSHYPCLASGGAMDARWCPGAECDWASECFALEARAQAQQAQVVVTNHALMARSLADNQFTQRFGARDVALFDEAHALLDVLRPRLRPVFSRDSMAQLLAVADDQQTLPASLHATLMRHYADWFACSDPRHPSANALRESLETSRGHLLPALYERWNSTLRDASQLTPHAGAYCAWDKRHLDFATSLARQVGYAGFVSATLTHQGSFDFFADSITLDSDKCETIELPHQWDYAGRTILYLPRLTPAADSPLPDPDVTASEILHLHDYLGGGGLVLFSSYERMRAVATELLPHVEVFTQRPDEPPRETADRFRDETDGLLLATGAYWNGMDLGPDLRFVAIDRLPFQRHNDVELAKHLDRISANGGDPFRDYQLPRTAWRLRQGIGRLMRSRNSQGVLAILDPRILSRDYGAQLLATLPNDIRRTSVLEQVRRFCAETLP